MIVLHDDALSAQCYTVRLLASMLEVPLETRAIDLIASPSAVVPVLVDDGRKLRDVIEILRHLAAYDRSNRWLPVPSEIAAACETWLAVSNALRDSAGAARRHETLGIAADIELCRRQAHELLRRLDRHLWFAEDETGGWLCAATHPTVADIACFPHVMLAPEGGVSLLEYPAVRRWTWRVKQIPGFIPMPGIFPAFLPSEVNTHRST